MQFTNAQWKKAAVFMQTTVRPLTVAAPLAAPLASRFTNVIEIELDTVVQEQQADGAWWPTWSWGDVYPTKQAWKGVITLKNLRPFQAYGRLLDGIEE